MCTVTSVVISSMLAPQEGRAGAAVTPPRRGHCNDARLVRHLEVTDECLKCAADYVVGTFAKKLGCDLCSTPLPAHSDGATSIGDGKGKLFDDDDDDDDDDGDAKIGV